MSDWLVPDPGEEALPRRHGWLRALPVTDRRMIAYRVRMARAAGRGAQPGQVAERIGREFGVTGRTAIRYAAERFPCPCACCLTLVRGGGLCAFCSKHEEKK